MAITDQISGVVGNFIGGSIMILVWTFVIVIVAVIIIGLAWYYGFYRKQFDIIVKVFSERYGEDKEFFDKGAILFDRQENTRYLRLLKTKVDLELPKFNIFRRTNWGDYVEVRRTGERTFHFMTPPKIDKEFYITLQGKRFMFSKAKQKIVESDITWILNRERKNKLIIKPESVLKLLLEHLPHIMTVIFFIFSMWMIFRYAPDFMNAIAEATSKIESANKANVVGSVILIFSKELWKI